MHAVRQSLPAAARSTDRVPDRIEGADLAGLAEHFVDIARAHLA
jgi:hypothetical protein